jgi:cytochrome c peroxidase
LLLLSTMPIRIPACLAALLLVLFTHSAMAAPEIPAAPGYGDLGYRLPAPGSYALPPLGTAAGGRVLDTAGRELELQSLYGDRIVLLSFIYASCSDVNGCPLATAVFHKIQKRLVKEQDLAKELRLVTLSFNPEHDTPETMARYGAAFGEGLDWRFLTTRSEADIQPILAAYDQSAQKDYDAEGRFLGTYSHILRVYLIDRERHIRNIYTVSFLHPDTLINDLRTLLLEKPKAAAATSTVPAAPLRAGDDKSGYERADYATRSLALAQRAGRPADLLAYAARPPLGLPPLPVPADNALSAERVALGRKLFFDRRLSLNNTFSCAMCHVPEQGFANNEQATAVGIEGRSVRRNTPSVYNAGYAARLFHDGREFSLEQQVWGPLLARNEMGAPSVGYVVEKVRGLSDYAGLFEAAYGRGPSMETIGQGIAAYERTLNSADSPFDRWHFGRRKDALSPAARLGFSLFTGKAGCAACHRIEEKSALFTDQDLHNTGLGFRAAMSGPAAKPKIQAAPGVVFELDPAALASVSEEKPADLGLYEITQNPADRWKYKTPSLRNVALTAPYMHDGSLAALKDVVRFYNEGGVPNENLDPRIKPLHLSEREMDALVEFLKSLTGSNVEALVSDAFTVPVGDPR